jgi:hypothetical protein
MKEKNILKEEAIKTIKETNKNIDLLCETMEELFNKLGIYLVDTPNTTNNKEDKRKEFKNIEEALEYIALTSQGIIIYLSNNFAENKISKNQEPDITLITTTITTIAILKKFLVLLNKEEVKETNKEAIKNFNEVISLLNAISDATIHHLKNNLGK